MYCAPGAGAGHLTRGCAVSMRLCALGASCRIVTNSPFAREVSRVTGCDIDFIPSEDWRASAYEYAVRLSPEVIALDSFPWGLRGEWAGRSVPGAEFVYIARRLKVDAYSEALGVEWDAGAPHVSRVVAAEPLMDDHEALIAAGGAEVVRLPGRIRLPDSFEAPPAPEGLRELIDNGRLWLAVHSGPREETDILLRAAADDMDASGGGRLALVSPEPRSGGEYPEFEYFPASRLFAGAHCVATGAGYNSVAEGAAFGGRHIAVPFRRRYDDQRGRLEGPDFGTEDGGPEAARYIFSLLGRDK